MSLKGPPRCTSTHRFMLLRSARGGTFRIILYRTAIRRGEGAISRGRSGERGERRRHSLTWWEVMAVRRNAFTRRSPKPRAAHTVPAIAKSLTSPHLAQNSSWAVLPTTRAGLRCAFSTASPFFPLLALRPTTRNLLRARGSGVSRGEGGEGRPGQSGEPTHRPQEAVFVCAGRGAAAGIRWRMGSVGVEIGARRRVEGSIRRGGELLVRKGGDQVDRKFLSFFLRP